MGFMDKAKKMAEQAQAKLDEAQKQFNSGQGGQQQGGGPAVEYDKHGRPIQPAPVTPDAAAPVPPAASAPPPRRDSRRAAHRGARAACAGVGPDAGPGRTGHARQRADGAAGDARPRADRRPQPAQHRAAEALERRPSSGLTLRECASCAPTTAC